MKKIEIDDDLYHYIASNTLSIGESASEILRRLLNLSQNNQKPQVIEKVSPGVIPEADITDVAIDSDSNENVFNVLNKEELAMQKGIVGRFLFVLSALNRTHKEKFSTVLDIKGRDRIYFATSKQALLDCGDSMNPKQIPDSQYWVMTNSNTTRKKMMLHEVVLSLGYSVAQAEEIRDFL